MKESDAASCWCRSRCEFRRAERDRKLAEKLKAEWPAILRWMLDGCLEWQRVGLVVPTIVRQATDEYLAEQDTLAQWAEETIELAADVFMLTRVLFKSWKLWCEERNLAAGDRDSFRRQFDRSAAMSGTAGIMVADSRV